MFWARRVASPRRQACWCGRELGVGPGWLSGCGHVEDMHTIIRAPASLEHAEASIDLVADVKRKGGLAAALLGRKREVAGDDPLTVQLW